MTQALRIVSKQSPPGPMDGTPTFLTTGTAPTRTVANILRFETGTGLSVKDLLAVDGRAVHFFLLHPDASPSIREHLFLASKRYDLDTLQAEQVEKIHFIIMFHHLYFCAALKHDLPPLQAPFPEKFHALVAVLPAEDKVDATSTLFGRPLTEIDKVRDDLLPKLKRVVNSLVNTSQFLEFLRLGIDSIKGYIDRDESNAKTVATQKMIGRVSLSFENSEPSTRRLRGGTRGGRHRTYKKSRSHDEGTAK